MLRHVQFATLISAAVLAGVLPGCATNPPCGSERCQRDTKITAEVQALFDMTPVLEPPNMLTIQTSDRVVFLYGLVANDLERQTAETVALRAPGVVMVVNGIAAEK
jgi:osmotically-inducible protein OsmY